MVKIPSMEEKVPRLKTHHPRGSQTSGNLSDISQPASPSYPCTGGDSIKIKSFFPFIHKSNWMKSGWKEKDCEAEAWPWINIEGQVTAYEIEKSVQNVTHMPVPGYVG